MKCRHVSVIAGGIFAFLLTVALSGCSKSGESPINNLGVPSPSDSLIYFYGLTEGAEYWREASYDTIMGTEKHRRQYLKGLRDGLDAVAETSDIYNRGLREGIDLALSLYDYNRIYGVQLDRDLLYRSIAYALQNDSVTTLAEAAEGYRKVLEKMDLRKRREEVRETRLTLKAEATRLDYTKVTADLYAGKVVTGTGESIRLGDIVFFNVTYTLENGDNLQMPSPEQVRVGSGAMSEVMTDILLHLRKGGEGKFLTTANSLFGTRASGIGLNPGQVVKVSVQVTEVKHIVDPEKLNEIAI